MNLSTIEQRPVRPGSRGDAPRSDEMSRRRWLLAAASVFAGSCAPEGPLDPDRAEGSAGAARGAVGSAVLPPPSRFTAWNQELRSKAPGRDVGLVDLDAVDQNVDVVESLLGPQFALRIVTKSLPSLALIEYVMNRAGTRRLMVFSEAQLRELLSARHGGALDILLGRPAPVEAAARTFAGSPRRARHVKWLIDTKERLLEYRDLAESVRHPVLVALEIDVGLRRGGARTATELLEMLDIVASSHGDLQLAGLMGYDGHVPFAPPGFDSDEEFVAVHERYSDLVQAGRDAHPQLFHDGLVMNSGGSGTFYRYGAGLATPVNEIAMGSGFVLPAHFADLSAVGLVPAIFQASPVLKRVDPAELPFAPGYLPSLAQSDPSLKTAYFMVAGGFPGDLVYPEGLVTNPFMPEGDGVKNLSPNQTLRNGAAEIPLGVGDFVFYHPWEGGGLAWLSAVEVLRGDHIVDRWTTTREGCLEGCGVGAPGEQAAK